MSAEPGSPTPSTVILTSEPDGERVAPPWLAEAVVLLRAMERVRVAAVEQVRVERGRMGLFETVDFVMVLLLHGVSGQPQLSETYEALFEDEASCPCRPRALRPEMALLPALWGRQTLPSRSALSRWLDDVSVEAVAALRQAFDADLHHNGLAGPLVGGCLDRTGRLHVVLEADGTVQAARQRALVHDALRPPARRRRGSMAPGYAGRKRADVVRTRVVVMQAHTHERLGTFGRKGNTDTMADLQQAAQAMAGYLTARALSVHQGLARLDGLYGHAVYIAGLAARGLGWLVRCADYRLLSHPQLLAALDQQTPCVFVSPETGMSRSVYDVGFLSWTGAKGSSIAVQTRLVLTLRDPLPSETKALRIGKRFRGRIAELFATDRTQEGFTGTDVLSLYLGRGGFEASLWHEDQQTDPDRFVSHHGPGQELFQVLCQWMDNVRLQLLPQEPVLRTTVWADAVEPGPVAAPDGGAVGALDAGAAPVGPVVPSVPLEPDASTGSEEADRSAPEPAAVAPARDGAFGQVAVARGRGSGRYGGQDFVWQPDGTLCCPAGQRLVCVTPRTKRGCAIYGAPAAICQACAQRSQCLGGGSQARTGRTVSVFPASQALVSPAPKAPTPALPEAPPLAAVAAPPAPVPGALPLLWQDIAALAGLRAARRALRSQRVEIERLDGPPVPVSSWQTRSERAHRRQTWARRHARNAQPAHRQWRAHLHGVPARIAAVLTGTDPPPHPTRPAPRASP